ncbi:hypothetical protein V7S43_007132 [Phytophthora oleae]|uniref:Uncharacterized protein n=1 Tax=Phytophthora oleae TaxID=2107226 RepID=A0ABD3FKZ8_9STRA
MAADSAAALALVKGADHPDIQTLIDREQMKAAWTIEDVLEDMPKPQSRQIHVLVVSSETIVYSSLPPKPLVKSEGAIWDFQNPLDDEDVSNAIWRHYNAW